MTQNRVDRSLQPVYGQPCWGLHYNRQLNLSMNFGQPSLDVREPFHTESESEFVQRIARRRRVTVRGDWWLWISCCYWQLSASGQELATGASSLRRIERAIRELDGQQLVSVAIRPETGATLFTFDLGCVLHCRRHEKNTDDELWTLYKPSGYVLSVYGNGTFSHDRGKAGKIRRHPLGPDSVGA